VFTRNGALVCILCSKAPLGRLPGTDSATRRRGKTIWFGGETMFLRIDKLPVELPASPDIDPVAAKNVQELLGGRFGEMSTLMNYTYQSFNFRSREKLRPYYALIANIAAEEGGHIEIVSAAINSCLNGPRTGFDSDEGSPLFNPWEGLPGGANPHHYIASGQGALPVNSNGAPWTGDYVFRRQPRARPAAQLLPRSRRAHPEAARVRNDFEPRGARDAGLPVRARRRARAGVRQGSGAAHGRRDVEDASIPKIANAKFPEAQKFLDEGSHRKLYRFSPEDYTEISQVWNGEAPGQLPRRASPAPSRSWTARPRAADLAHLAGIATSFAPEYAPEEIFEMANKLTPRPGQVARFSKHNSRPQVLRAAVYF
jgi:Mn-containing catalase